MGRIVAETTLLFTLCFLLYGTVAFAFTTTKKTPTSLPYSNQQHQQVHAPFAFTTTKKTPTLLPYSNQQHQQVHASKYYNSPLLSIGLHSQRVRSSLALIPTRFSHFPLTIQKSVASDDNSNNDDDDGVVDEDRLFDLRTTVGLIGGQSLLIVAAIFVAKLVGTPNYGLGKNINFGVPSICSGIVWTLPLGILAYVLDIIENKFPSLQDVTKATQSSVLSLLGGKFKPIIGTLVALALGIAAGLGEEMLFRGVLQDQLGIRMGNNIFAVGISSIIFGLLHAVTPLYALLAGLASIFFGWIYIVTGNLAVPIVTHAFYDWVALLYAHWTVTNLSGDQQQALLEWRLGGDGGTDTDDSD